MFANPDFDNKYADHSRTINNHTSPEI